MNLRRRNHLRKVLREARRILLEEEDFQSVESLLDPEFEQKEAEKTASKEAGKAMPWAKVSKKLKRLPDDIKGQLEPHWNSLTQDGKASFATQAGKLFQAILKLDSQDSRHIPDEKLNDVTYLKGQLDKAVMYFEDRRIGYEDAAKAETTQGVKDMGVTIKNKIEAGDFDDPQEVIKYYGDLGAEEKADFKAALRRGLNDGNPEDDKIEGIKVNKPCKDLQPTQNEIDATKSIAFPLGNGDSFLKTLLQGVATAPEIAGSGKYVLDGHHRWSSTYAINPDATIPFFDLQFPDKLTPMSNGGMGYLAISQLAILTAIPGEGNVPFSTTTPGAFNLLDDTYKGNATGIFSQIASVATMDKGGEMGKYVHLNDEWWDTVWPEKGEEVIKKIHPTIAGKSYDAGGEHKIDVPSDVNAAIEAGYGQGLPTDDRAKRISFGMMVMAYVAENLATLPRNDEKSTDELPSRGVMPQFDAKEAGDDYGKYDLLQRMGKGEIDVVKESAARWQKLAGILKD